MQHGQKLMAAAILGMAAGLGGVPPVGVDVGRWKPGTRWPHNTKKRYPRAERVARYKAQRSANRQRRLRLA